jgi:hypothetical protein
MATSTALFGSVARGDRDEFSDIDLLVVGDNSAELTEHAQALASKGFACSTYTWSKLRYIADRGSLFVAHLKYEGIILTDPQNRLKQLLESYQARASYRGLKQDAVRIVQLLAAVPDNAAGHSWACDVLFTAFRTFAVPHLAERGKFRFAHGELVNGLCHERCDLEEFREAFLNLRRAKSLYRRRMSDTVGCTENSLRRSALGLARLFGRGVPLRKRSVKECLGQTIVELSKPRRRGYLNLRSIERACVAMDAPMFARHATGLAELRRQVAAPAAYAFSTYPGREGQIRSLRIVRQALKCIA